MTLAAPLGGIASRGLTRRFGERIAVHPFDLDVAPGTATGLLGPNGSGKTTFLRMLLGLVPPDAGSASVDGTPLRGDGTAIRRRATYVPGEFALYGEQSGKEHLAWCLRGRRPRALERAREVAAELGLDLRKKVRAYSQGMKRQLLVAAGLGPEVRVRLFDEPTDGLDPTLRRAVLALLRREVEAGVTVFLSSHHLAEVEDLCERVVFFHEGRILSDEAASELRRRAQSVVRVRWSAPFDAAAFARRARAWGAASVRVEERSATLRLEGEDALAFLARWRESGEPAPAALDWGGLSLAELYRDLYGVEGL